MTKIYCGCIKCKYNTKGICKAKEISLTHDSILTVYQGRREFNTCKMEEESDEYRELREKLNKLICKEEDNANSSK